MDELFLACFAVDPPCSAFSWRSGRPGAPTDPDMRDYRIRLFESRIRCSQRQGVSDAWQRERVALE
jgi:hypothetical protein